jgi:hypothetical protein
MRAVKFCCDTHWSLWFSEPIGTLLVVYDYDYDYDNDNE